MKTSTLANLSRLVSFKRSPKREMLEKEANRLDPTHCECGVPMRPLSIVIGGGLKASLESKDEACHACRKVNKRYYVRN
nr:hypothetical protein [Jeotgalibacillus malaysiensis]